ncbi:Ser/Thr protein kinase RdoA (MazF antagonist) [Sphaerotilus hippei]|uniref:Stress response kinase A n=1 Tax=Sphaerotilus hippei TaxID=744406 RepID=A0A318H1A8_9BURK|nr:serine/threonine protein kinase [Sphaerotilus hippei]PXW96973.1 Ser/Thr protein kinase RdoA (MazF antagonist) [Sphaerotilus hippei]
MTDHDPEQPYAGLTPHAVLDALDAAGLRGDGRILQLNSYENRVFQVHLEESLDPGAAQPPIVVAKFYRDGRWSDAQILEEHHFALELAAAEVPAVPPLVLQPPVDLPAGQPVATLTGQPPTLARVGGWRFGVSPRCGGRAPELDQPETLEWIGRFLARLHLVGRQRPFEHRLTLDGSRAARAAVAWLIDGDVLPPDALGGWHSACLRALDAVDTRFERHGPLELMRLHGDCHAGNLLWTGSGPHFVDLDDAVNGPAVQDLWMLLGGERHEMQAQLGALLDGYETLREFDRRELALIEPLRTLRLIGHSAWIARRWADPAFPIAFPSFESPSYWAQQTMQLHEQIEAMQDEPLVA